MRIGFFTDTYHPIANGIVTVLDLLQKNLNALGHEVFIVAPKPIGKSKLRSNDHLLLIPAIEGILYGEQMTSLFLPRDQMRKINNLNLHIIAFLTPSQIGFLGISVATRQRLPLVAFYTTDLIDYARRYRMATVAGIIGLGLFVMPRALAMTPTERRQTNQSLRRRNRRMLSRRQNILVNLLGVLHNHTSLVVAVSKKTATELKSWESHTPVVTIPTGVDALPVESRIVEEYRKKLGLERDAKVIMYVGRLGAEKNLELLIQAFEEVAATDSTAKLVFVGGFGHRKFLEKLAKRSAYRERIIFTGQIPRQQLGSMYALADVFAFPSITDTQGLVINEAAHAGLPFVWIDSKLNDILVDGQTGFQAVNNPADFAQKLNRLLRDKQIRRAFGQNARKRALQCNELGQTKKLVQALEGLLSKR